MLRGILTRIRAIWKTANVVLLTGLAAVVAVAVYLAITRTSGGDGQQAVASPDRGVACPHLREAYDESLAGDAAAVGRSVQAAALAGQTALDRSGQVFGRPEEIALELDYAMSQNPGRVTRKTAGLLNEARTTCRRLGRWFGGE